MFENLPLSIPALHWRDLLDISLVAFVLYRVILLVRGTRAVSVIFGLLLVLLVYYLSGEFGLYTLHWLLANFLGSIFLVIIILFQQDIRKALAEMGAAGLWRRRNTTPQILDELVLAVMEMAQRRIGAQHLVLADHLRQRLRPQKVGQWARRGGGWRRIAGVEQVRHASNPRQDPLGHPVTYAQGQALCKHAGFLFGPNTQILRLIARCHPVR